MAIDSRMYEKYSGRSGDPYTRLGQALAQDAKAKQERDAMPKGLSGGVKTVVKPGLFANLWYAIKDRLRSK
jgi:hypothetical protein